MSTPADRSRPWEDRRLSTRIRYAESSSSPSGSEPAAERLTDDLLVEILSRVPARSLCRFKCVSKHWLGLTNDRNYRRKLPRTLTGFYCKVDPSVHSALSFTNVSGSRHLTHPAFLPNGCRVEIMDCCNGLLLCSSYHAHGFWLCYLVCNPATEEWTELPRSGYSGVYSLRLCFDPAVSPHFHVCFLAKGEDGLGLGGVLVYSSETRRWVSKEKKWNCDIEIANDWSTVYLNGSLHFCAYVDGSASCLAAVDKQGGARTNFGVPDDLDVCFIQLSQGCLHYAGFCTETEDSDDDVVRLQVYVLTNYGGKEWTLKHSTETSHMFGHIDDLYEDFDWIAIHPECNLIFFTVGRDITFMCYDMDRRQVKVIHDLEELGERPYFPYVPLYEELQSLPK